MRAGRRGETGFTIVEVVVAALMLALVAAAGTALFAVGNDNSAASQRQSQLISVLDQQMEQIRSEVKTEGFNKLAMNGAPSGISQFTVGSYSSGINADPDAFVSSQPGCGPSNQELLLQANYDNAAEGIPLSLIDSGGTYSTATLPVFAGCTDTSSQFGEPLEVLSGTGFVTPQQTVSVGTETAVIDTYVTDTYVGCDSGFGSCPTVSNGVVTCTSWPTSSGSTACADARRVVIAAVLDNHGRYDIGPSAPLYLSSVFTNPTPSNEPSSPIGVTLGVQVG